MNIKEVHILLIADYAHGTEVVAVELKNHKSTA
jgi:hypothetical protein